MYSSLHIKHFRALQDALLDRLGRVNLIVGPNNVGKTSLLEAAWLFQGPGNPRLTMNISTFRGLEPTPGAADILWDWLFHNLAVDEPVEIEGVESLGIRRSLRMALSRSPMERFVPEVDKLRETSQAQVAETSPMTADVLRYEYRVGDAAPVVTTIESLPGTYELEVNIKVSRPTSILLSARVMSSPREIADRFTQVVDAGRLEFLVESLQMLEPRLTSLSLGYAHGRPIIRGHTGLKRPVPLSLLGGGAIRLIEILLAILAANEGLVLIDEIENGFYYQHLETNWKAIEVASRAVKAQVIATTHSMECVRGAVAAFGNGRAGDFRLFRLERKKDRVKVFSYDYKKAEAAMALNLEVR